MFLLILNGKLGAELLLLVDFAQTIATRKTPKRMSHQ